MRRLVPAALGAFIAATIGLGLSTPAATAATPTTLLQVNVNGGAYGGDAASISDVIGQIQSLQPDAVTLQEVCQQQAIRLINTFGSQVMLRSHKNQGNCGAGEDSIQYYAIISKWIPQTPQTPFFNYSSGDSVGMMCAIIPKPGAPFTACSTKFDAGNANALRVQQSAELKNWVLGPYGLQNTRVAIGADLNAQPTEAPLDRMYRVSSTGSFSDPNGTRGLFMEGDETDGAYQPGSCTGSNPRHCRSGQPTHSTSGGSSKIDYAFWRFGDALYERNPISLRVIARPAAPNGNAHHMLFSTVNAA